jgi:hypothetical protein
LGRERELRNVDLEPEAARRLEHVTAGDVPVAERVGCVRVVFVALVEELEFQIEESCPLRRLGHHRLALRM